MYGAAEFSAAHLSDTDDAQQQGLDLAAAAQIDRIIAGIDATLSAQVRAIQAHPDFQAMEARWRGLDMLVRQTAGTAEIVVKVLDLSWHDLSRDLQRAADFDQSRLFELIYNQEFGMPGGQPFGLLVGDYHFSHVTDRARGDQVDTLRRMAAIAAAAFAPFVAALSADALGLSDFDELASEPHPKMAGNTADRLRWSSLRTQADSRFVGLVAPMLRLRGPSPEVSVDTPHGFCFGTQPDALLWMNGAFGFAATVCAAFAESGWFANILGTPSDSGQGGQLTCVTAHDFGTDKHGLSRQAPVQVRLTATQELALADHGIIPISTNDWRPAPVLNTCPALHQPEAYDSPAARQNAKLSAMLNYVLCASRFAHFLKVILRDEVGGVEDANTLQRKLFAWLNAYCIGNDSADAELKARHPLRDAGVAVRAIPGRPGVYACQIRLQPHFQLDHIETSFQLIAETSESGTDPRRAA